MRWAKLSMVEQAAEKAPELLRRAAGVLASRQSLDPAMLQELQDFNRSRHRHHNDRFDIFLSYATRDIVLALGVWQLLQKADLQVYMDWIDDPQLDRTHVNRATAEVLRKRMRNSNRMIFISSGKSSDSRWMPWEVGFFDAAVGRVAVLPVRAGPPDVEKEGDTAFVQQEYLNLYPTIGLADAKTRVEAPATGQKPPEDLPQWAEQASKDLLMALPALQPHLDNTAFQLLKDPLQALPESTQLGNMISEAITKSSRNR